MSKPVRVRFAPSPTGPLHIGGVRTALYNYLFARKHQGTFILRIEDTDQKRYVEGAEAYIIRSMNWLGLPFDESPAKGGPYGPYRQSDRKDLYIQYANQLVQSGKAYYAFDTPEELAALREKLTAEKAPATNYGSASRMSMKNSLTLSKTEVQEWLDSGKPYVIRLKIEPGQEVSFRDMIREDVQFSTNLLDDKVLLKADGMPTYHLANVVDDYTMKISHVIRGVEWLSSTAHHVLLYRAFGWEEDIPKFAHLPLILKPNGKGKLSKRDGAKFNVPVFPLSWKAKNPEDSFKGFDEFGFFPEAVINFLAMLGWHPEDEQEIFTLEELSKAFSIYRVSKSGAIFDYEKAKWFNQQYLLAMSVDELAQKLQPLLKKTDYNPSPAYLKEVIKLMQPRATFLQDILEQGYFFFEDVKVYDKKALKKRWKPEKQAILDELADVLEGVDRFLPKYIEAAIKEWMGEKELGFGAVFPLIRLALAGTLQGPDIFEMISVLTKHVTVKRLRTFSEKVGAV
ncbi:MAG TPA: glutamate--tRNA ligase [Saprospiraceae bacterium]|nr:glutamate--tRNA ligase [Saprospiraceae bacterium]